MTARDTLQEVRKALKATIATYPYQRCEGKPCRGCRAQAKAGAALAKIDALLSDMIEAERRG